MQQPIIGYAASDIIIIERSFVIQYAIVGNKFFIVQHPFVVNDFVALVDESIVIDHRRTRLVVQYTSIGERGTAE